MNVHLSVIIPARDEALTLPLCVHSVRNSFRDLSIVHVDATLEIIVIVNRCTDRTEDVARGLGCKIVHGEAKNLAALRNIGAGSATGSILITIDADSKMSANLLTAIVVSLSEGNAIGGGVLILPERWSIGIVVTGLMLLPIAVRHRISAGCFFCSRETFRKLGGFDETLSSVEDIDFAKRLKAFGKTEGKLFHNILKAYIITSCRKFDRFGDWYFVLHPGTFFKLLKGRDQQLADKVWYDFER